MSSSRKARQFFVIQGFVVGAISTAAALLVAEPAAAQTSRQRGTFTISGNTALGLQGFTTGFLDDEEPGSKVDNAKLSAQSIASFKVSYSGTVTADISFDSVTKQITGIHVADANLVAGNSGDWRPGNWDGSGWADDGAQTEAANYGGSVAGAIVFATRGLTLSMDNQGAVYPVAPGGDFTVSTTQKVQFTGGNNGLFADGLVNSNDLLTIYENYQSDTLAVQPATFTYLDDMGMPQVLPNPQAGKLYPSSLVWKYVTSKTDVPVFDALGNPVYKTPGDPTSGQKTEDVRTYGDLAPAFEGTKGGLQPGAQPLDEDWYHPHDGAVGKPDVVRAYTLSTTEFDSLGNPLPILGQLEMSNTGLNYSDGAGTVPVSSNIAATLNGGTGKYDASLALNMNATAPFFVGDFAVSLIVGQSRHVLFGNLEPGTGRIFADAALSLKAGDVNNDGIVNIFDINMVSANWSPKPNADLYAGDANSDGIVNIFDINLISSNWSPAGTTAVPEPSTIVLAVLGSLAIAWNYRRRRAV